MFPANISLGRIDFQGPVPSTKEVYRRALNIAWPSAAETVLVSLVGSVDTIMVGGLGPAAIAAVGLTNQPKFILLALINSLNVGVTTVVARRRGQENREGAPEMCACRINDHLHTFANSGDSGICLCRADYEHFRRCSGYHAGLD